MSVQALGAVLDYSESRGGARLSAISLGNHADKYGIVFLSIKTIASEAKAGERTVTEHLAKLRELGELEVVVEADGKTHRPRLYRLCLQGLSGNLDPSHAYFQTFGSIEELSEDPGAKFAGGPDAVLAGGPGASSAPPGCEIPQAPHIEEPSSNQKQPPSPQGGEPSVAVEIFEYWKGLTGRNGATQLTRNRKRAIEARVKEGRSVEQLRDAIAGCTKSDFHMKRGLHASRDGDVHDDLTLILRNGENVERFARMAGTTRPAADGAHSVRPDELVPAGPDVQSGWEETKSSLHHYVDEEEFEQWIAPLEVAGIRNGNLVLVDSTETGGGAFERYGNLIQTTLRAVCHVDNGIEIVDETALEMSAA